jgi:hypothetical protein
MVPSLHPCAVHPYLPRAQQFFKASVGESGEMAAEPAVETQPVLILVYGKVADACHGNAHRVAITKIMFMVFFVLS